MELNEMKRIMSLFFQAVNEKDAYLIENYLAEEIIWHDGCGGENGADIIFEWSKQDFIKGNILGGGGFHKTKTVNIQIAEGDKVFTLFTVEGVHDMGDCMGYPPTGKHIRYNAQYTARFEKGLITEIWATMDGHLLLNQLGVI